ncbi:hypothetical protein BH18ACT6_BH18ACT6_12080 [soil metagenome]
MALLERDSLLDQLAQGVTTAASGQGVLVLLTGEAGAGKTSVVREFEKRVGPKALVLWGACDPLTTPRPLSPLLDVLADPHSGLGHLAGSEQDRFALFAGFLDRLRVTSRPIVLVIEDVHWADDGTLDFLRFLGRRIEQTKSMAVCTYRDDEVGPHHPLRSVLGELASKGSTWRLAVPPLSVAAVQVLSQYPADEAAKLHSQTDGNAFFVTEVLAAGDHLPTSVQDAVLARVRRLGEGPRRIVEAVSIAPRELEIDFAKALAEVETADVDENLKVLVVARPPLEPKV